MKKGISESLKKIQCFAFRNIASKNSTEGQNSSLSIDNILKQNFFAMGSNTGQTGVTVVQRMRYAKITMSCS